MNNKVINPQEVSSEILDIKSIPKDIDKEISTEYLEQFPNFKASVKGLAGQFTSLCETAVKEDDKETFRTCQRALDSMVILVRGEYLSENMRQLVAEKMTEINSQTITTENVSILSDFIETIAITTTFTITKKQNKKHKSPQLH